MAYRACGVSEHHSRRLKIMGVNGANEPKHGIYSRVEIKIRPFLKM